MVDRNGIQPTRTGALPPHLAAFMQTNISVQALAVEAALTGKREHICRAVKLDPHSAAELDLDQLWRLVDDLIAAHASWLPATEPAGRRSNCGDLQGDGAGSIRRLPVDARQNVNFLNPSA